MVQPFSGYFNPRSPDGERPGKARLVLSIMYFNPRSPDGERRRLDYGVRETVAFQSTLPGWGATSGAAERPASPQISIHAPRMGSDPVVVSHTALFVISIHAPRMGSDLVKSAMHDFTS